MNMKRFIITIILVAGMALSTQSPILAYGAMTGLPIPVSTNALNSSDSFLGEYFRITTDLQNFGTVRIEGHSSVKTYMYCIRLVNRSSSLSTDKYPVTIFIKPNEAGNFAVQFSILYGNKRPPAIIDGKGTVDMVSFPWATRPGYLSVPNMPAGYYNLTIARAKTKTEAENPDGWFKGPLGGSRGYAYKEALLQVGDGDSNNPKVVYYANTIQNNQSIRSSLEKAADTDVDYPGSYVRYRDVYMKDMEFLFTNPVSKVSSPMTSTKVTYLKDFAKQVTYGATSDYERMQKIYAFVGSRVYYDQYAYDTGKYQYADPYRNLYNMKNGISSANSIRVTSTDAKVATVCHGYAAMVIALARASGIPARFVRGNHISLPLENWSMISKDDILQNTHWWAEAYVDGRWITIDANSATQNRWTRTSLTDPGKWNYTGLLTYAHFDPSEKQLSNSYIINSIYPGSKLGKYLAYTDEVSKVRTFLETKDKSGIRNGTKLRTAYDPENLSSWGTGIDNNFNTDGYGRAYRISWTERNLTGQINLSGFPKLKYVSLWNNQLTGVDVSGCKNLTGLYAKGNRLTSAKIYHNGKTINVSRVGTGGYFGINYEKTSTGTKMTICAASAPGYKYLGIYSSSGNRLTTNSVYSVSPSLTVYYVKYARI